MFAPPFDIYNLPDDAPREEMQEIIAAALREVGEDSRGTERYSVRVSCDLSWEAAWRAFNLARARFGYIPFPDPETLRAANDTWTL